MKAVALMAVLACLLIGCTKDYYEVKKADLPQAFIVNSSPTFQGYWYEGSDAAYHYFISKWQYGSDKRFKISTADLAVSREAVFGQEELRVFLFEPQNLECEPFAKIRDQIIFIQKK
jgi:hypothetical protein